MFTFQIPIGDWSNDGHGLCDYFTVVSNKTIEEFGEAYRAAQKKLPSSIHPTAFVDSYDNAEVPNSIYEQIKDTGFVFSPETEVPYSTEDGRVISSNWMADYVCWFVQQGDPELTVEIVPSLEVFHFDCRHVGYGLFIR
jgi:hypothetical protein